jgi:hypothetical protein
MTNTGPDDRKSLVGADVDRAWRAQSREEPAASVDASILAAAHREAGARPQSVDAKEARAARRRWWPLAAAATVAAIVVGVFQVTPPEEIGAPSAQHATVSDMPALPAKKTEGIPMAPAPRAPRAPQDTATPSTGGSENRAPTEAPRIAAMPRQAPVAAAQEPMRQRTEARPAPPASRAPEPFPAAPNRVDAGASASPGSQAAPLARKEAPAPPAAAGAVAAERATPAPAAVAAAPDARKAEAALPAPAPLAKMSAARADEAAGAARVKDRAPLPIPDWIALIRRLLAEGKTVEAAKELAAFRAAHTDHEKLLPPDLRDWHPPEK